MRAPAPTRAASSRPALEFHDVSKTFKDGTRALDRTSLTVAPGEFVTVVGPSGCGKSTLLRVASGLERPTTGSVTVDKQSLGYVFQDADAPAVANGAQERRPLRRARQDAQGAAAATRAGEHRPRRPQRVRGQVPEAAVRRHADAGVARPVPRDGPDVFLFDEPFGALDEITRERLNDELLGLFQRKGFGALFITHSIYEAVFLSTRVLVMSAATRTDRGVVRRAVRVPALARAALRRRLRRPVRRGQPRAPRGARVSDGRDRRHGRHRVRRARRGAAGRRGVEAAARPARHHRPAGRVRDCSSAGGTSCTTGACEHIFDKPAIPDAAAARDPLRLVRPQGAAAGRQHVRRRARPTCSRRCGSTDEVDGARAVRSRSCWASSSPSVMTPSSLARAQHLAVPGRPAGRADPRDLAGPRQHLRLRVANTRLIVCVIISIVPIVSNTLFGLRSVDSGQHDLFTLQGRVAAGPGSRSCSSRPRLPAIFTGFRISAGLAVIGAVVGELFNRQGSKGHRHR